MMPTDCSILRDDPAIEKLNVFAPIDKAGY